MLRFSANLGLLWRERSLPDAIHTAAQNGFDAAECHWPYSIDPKKVKNALDGAELEMISLNTVVGDAAVGERGLLALPGRESEARVAINQAIEYATKINCRNIHAMAGNASGSRAEECYLDNLSYAADQANGTGVSILIEPLNTFDNPGYFLFTSKHAIQILDSLNRNNVKLMFDCYHIARMEGGVEDKLEVLLPYIEHVQIASVPERHEPVADEGELNYRNVFGKINALSYSGYIGAEYHPKSTTVAGLGWLRNLKTAADS